MTPLNEASRVWNTEQMDRLIFNQYPCGACIFEVSKNSVKLIMANEQYVRELGREHMMTENALELSWPSFMDKRSMQQIFDKMNHMMETGEGITDEAAFSGIDPTKEITWLRANMRLLEKQGDLGLIFCVIENITEQKLLEQKQKEASEQLHAIMDNINGGVTAVTLDEDNQVHFLFANDCYYQQIGYTREELEEKRISVFDLVHPDDQALVIEKTRLGSIERKPFSVIYRVLRGDGTIIWIESNISIINITGVVEPVQIGVANDITAQRIAEKNEHEAAAQLQMIMQNIHAGVSVATLVNHEINYIFLNDEYYTMFGYTREEFHDKLPHGLSDIINPDDLPVIYQMTDESEISGQARNMEFRVQKQEGTTIWVRSCSSVCYMKEIEEPIHIAVIHDITKEREAAEALRIHEEEMKLSMAQMGKMICEYDPVTLTLVIPEAYASWYGVSQTYDNVPYNQGIKQFVPEDFIQGYIDFYEAIHRGEKTGSYDCSVRHLDDTWHWEHYEFITIFDDNNKPVKAILSVEDTTEQRKMRNRYEREVQLRHEIIKNSCISYQLNLTTDIIEEYQSEFMDVPSMCANSVANEQIRKEVLANIAEEDRDKVKNTILSSALRDAYHDGKTNITTEYRRRIPRRGICWVRAIATMIKRPETNDLIAFLYISNIDQEKKKQLALEAILDEEIEASLLLHVNNEKAYICKRRSMTLPYNTGEWISYSDFQHDYIQRIMIEEDRESAIEFLSSKRLLKTLRKEKTARFVFRKQETDGGLSQKLIRAIFLDNSEEDIVFSVQDITVIYEEEKRQKEELQQAVDMANRANHAKSEFLSRMSHDIRTPLNAVLAFSSEEMLRDSTQLQLQDYLMKIHAAGNYLLGIVNDVLDMSKIEQKKVALRPEPYSIEDFVDTIRTVIGEMSKGKEVDFTMTIHDIMIHEVIVDKIRFNQIFINLLSNAVKFTPSGGKVEFIIEPYSRIASGAKLRLSQPGSEHRTYAMKRFIVRDNGIGMSENFLPHAFECFSQEYRNDVSEKSQGTGLGLSIVYELVQMMNGSITVESKYEEGTSFTVELPLEIDADFNDEKEIKTENNSSLKNRRILLCEDNLINVEIAQLLLEKQGCITECALNGKEGYDMFRQSTVGYYDAILMDIRMPVMNGIEAAKAIRALEREDAAGIPIIAMTADAFVEDEENSREAGMSGHLSKPVVPEALYTMLFNTIK